MKILIVDDQLENRLLLEAFLGSAGYSNLLSVESAMEAFNALGMGAGGESEPVDLILMDIMMPGVDGIEACRRIKENESLRDIPIIMITARVDKEALRSAFEAGAMDYITKPINDIELQARVGSALSLKREMDSRKAREEELIMLTGKLEDANTKLQGLSITDELTMVANRRYLKEHLDHEWRRAIRSSKPLSLIMIDIDFFKHFNDTYGHQAGDDCLKSVAKALVDSLHRPGDLLARYGGEEFLVVLPETPAKGASEIAEKMRKKVMDLNILHKMPRAGDRVTISAGVATSVASRGSSARKLIKEADKALYRAKREGRNRVKVGKVGSHEDHMA